MSAGIEKPSFSSGLAVANGGLSCSLFWFGQPDSNDPRHPERNKIDSKKNDHARVRAPLTLDHKPSEVSTSPAANRPKGTSKNSPYSPHTTKLPANDSASFSFRFIYVHSSAVRDRQ